MKNVLLLLAQGFEDLVIRVILIIKGMGYRGIISRPLPISPGIASKFSSVNCDRLQEGV